MRVVVSDTSPICYLVLIGEVGLLEKLYRRVLMPQAVYEELSAQQTPAAVRAWIEAAPSWIEVFLASQLCSEDVVSCTLDPGERAAIALALEKKADLILMDERAGVNEARRLGINVTGTLGVLTRGAEHGLIDLSLALEKLQVTNFRVSPELIRQILRDDAHRSKSSL